MRATRFNHVSVHADDLEESVRFYVEIFGMERVPAPNFGDPVAWLRLGEQQLHLFQRATPAPDFHHIGLDVDDFEAVYDRVREHPAGWVQMYLRDPAGNLVEVDWPDASTLPPSVTAELQRLEDEVPQTEESLRARLYEVPAGTATGA